MDLPPIIYIISTTTREFHVTGSLRDIEVLVGASVTFRAASRRFQAGRQKHFVCNTFYSFPGYCLLVRFLFLPALLG